MRLVGGQRAAILVVAALMLAGCSDGRSPEKDADTPVSPSADRTDVAPLDEALGLLSREVSLVDFSSDRHSAARLGLFDDAATSAADLGVAYGEAVDDVDGTDLAAIGTLADAVEDMTEGGAAFSQIDVRWSMRAKTGDGPTDDDGRSVQVFRLTDGVDMDEVLADLEDAGFAATSASGWEHLHLDGQLSDSVDVLDGNTIDGRYPQDFFPDVSVHRAAHLVALGDTEVLLTDGSSGETLKALSPFLPAATADVERFALTSYGYMQCYAPVDKTTNFRATLEKVAAWSRRFGIEDLGVPGVTSLAWIPGEDVVHRSFFIDEPSAERALVARKRLYSGAAQETEAALGVLMPAQGNDSPYEPGWRMSREGNVVTVLHNATSPADAVYTYGLHGLGFDTCGAKGMFS